MNELLLRLSWIEKKGNDSVNRISLLSESTFTPLQKIMEMIRAGHAKDVDEALRKMDSTGAYPTHPPGEHWIHR